MCSFLPTAEAPCPVKHIAGAFSPQIADKDDELNTVITQEPRGPSLPILFAFHCATSPCGSTTILDNDTAVFLRQAQLGTFGERMMY